MRIVIALWLGFVVTLSLIPLRVKYRIGTMGIFHNPGHFLVFFITALLLCGAARSSLSRVLRGLAVCFFAVLMEVLEWAVYHSRLEWHDILVDLSGIFVALLFVSAWWMFAGRFAAQQNV